MTDAAEDRSRRRRGAMLGMVVDLIVPASVYYALRAGGIDIYLSLLLTAAIPSTVLLVRLLRERTLDGPAAYVLTIMLLSTAAALVSGSQQFLLAKEGWITGISAIWFLMSVRAARPLTFLLSRPLLEGRGRMPRDSWDHLWELHPRFRHLWKVSTAMWGIGLLLDCVLRIVMAYALPPDSVPGLGAALYGVTSLILIGVTNGYYVVAGLYDSASAMYAAPTSAEALGQPNSTREA